MDRKIFFTDLDGTLLKSDGSFCKKDLEALEELGEKGVIRVLATGRSLFSFKKSVKTKLPLDYMIFSTGAGICSYPEMEENILKSENLKPSETKFIASHFEEMGLNYMIHREVPNNHIFFYKSSGPSSDFDLRLKFYSNYANPLENDFRYGPSAQLLSILQEDMDDLILSEIRERLAGFNVIKTTSPFDHKSIWIEVFPESVSKSSGAQWLCEKTGCVKDNTFAIGNDYNDLDLLEWAAKAAAVDNAPCDIKERFLNVNSNNNSGVSEAVKLWLNQKR